MEHHFRLEATWQGGRLGQGELHGRGLSTAISVPREMGGPGIGSNPEELLIGAAMNCYIITLAAILERRRLSVKSLTLRSEGIVNVEGGNMSFTKIIHRPVIVLAQGDEKTVETATYAAHRAEEVCMISKAIRGNVELSVEPVVEVEEIV